MTAQLNTNWNPKLYNDKHSFVYQYGEEIVELLAPQSHESILDLGCGSGQLTAKIAESAQEVVGMDFSEEMIEDARAKYPNIPFGVGDASDFSVEQQFDAIFSNATLHWVIEAESAASCMYDAIKPGGRLVLEMGGFGNIQTIVQSLCSVLAKKGYTEQSELNLWYFPSIGEYADVLEEAGFHLKGMWHIDRPTLLEDKDAGIIDWLKMFAKAFLKGVPENEHLDILTEAQELSRENCFIDGKWYADYKRLRVVATKPF